MADKVGIITQYYKSHNYGGLLQAYALTNVIKKLGYNVDQIAYDGRNDNCQSVLCDSVLQEQKKNIKSRVKALGRWMLDFSISGRMNKRFNAMERFGNSIPHSDMVYTQEVLRKLLDEYRYFVVGSDQVWNPQFYAPVYFCDFAKGTDAKCISYAASVSQKDLTNRQKEIYKEHMKNFSAISLRESNTEIIQELTETKVEWVLDPTLLLNREDWDIISSERLLQEPYVFCYFLGNDPMERRLAKKFAKSQNCKLVTIPHLSGNYEKSDLGFGDEKIIAASPEEFISLIKYADYVFTDSFHATVFSHIYEKQFFVFQRAGMKGMSTRIDTLLSLFENTNRFCDTQQKQTMEYLLSCSDVNYEKEKNKFQCKKEESLNFIRRALGNEV